MFIAWKDGSSLSATAGDELSYIYTYWFLFRSAHLLYIYSNIMVSNIGDFNTSQSNFMCIILCSWKNYIYIGAA